MNIEEIIKAWKSEEGAWDVSMPENPVGHELSEEELEKVVGGVRCSITCEDSTLNCEPYYTYV